LARQDIVVASNKLKDIGEVTQNSVEAIAAIINNKPININLDLSKLIQGKWNIPDTWDFDSLPIKLTIDQLQSTVIMLWKQFMLHDEVDQAISFLENAPIEVRNSKDTIKALELTKNFRSQLSEYNQLSEPVKVTPPVFKENYLDIIFFAGNGVEIWTPETIKKTGIGVVS